jgi:hypothetical protein
LCVRLVAERACFATPGGAMGRTGSDWVRFPNPKSRQFANWAGIALGFSVRGWVVRCGVGGVWWMVLTAWG